MVVRFANGACFARLPIAALLITALLITALLITVVGCNPTAGQSGGKKPEEKPATSPKAATSETEANDASRAWLDRMAAAYRKAQSYSDQGELTFSVRGTTPQDAEEKQTFPYSVALVRPNQLRLAAYQGLVVSDGSKVRAKIVNRDNNDLDNQVVELPAPPEFTADVLATWNSALLGVLAENVAGPPPQLRFLTQERAVEELIGSGARLALLAEQEIDGRKCRGVQFEDDAGRSVLWIDVATHELRRLQFPVAALAAQMRVEPGQITLVADFHKARLGSPVTSDSFSFALPPQPRIVKYLVPPPPTAPLELLGKPLPPVTFTGADGTRVAGDQFSGKAAVLCFFSMDDRAGHLALADLNRLWQESLKAKGNSRVFAISTDPASVSGEKISRHVRQQAGEIPLLRAAELRGANTLSIKSLPTTLLVDRDGKVQDILPGYNVEVFNEIPRRIEAIEAGEDFHNKVAQQFAEDDERYRQMLDLATRGGVAEKSEPLVLRRLPRWQFREVREPGNLTVMTDGGGKPRIFVIEAFRRIVELDPTGRLVARHDPRLPPEARISYLRAARDRDGRLWLAACAPGQPQLFLLDERFELKLSYPQRQDVAIGDAQLADLDGDGTLELVIGYLGVNGIHAVSLDGTRKWRNPSVEDVSRLVLVDPADSTAGRQILAATYGGRVTPIDARGADAAKWQPDAGVIQHFLAVNGRLCAVAGTRKGTFVAAGLKLDGTSLWEHPLPFGRSIKPIEPIAWGRVGSENPHWMVASADASIHFLNSEGKVIDQFNYGSSLAGIAALPDSEGRDLLLLSTDDGIEAVDFR
jgi:peroxiredoxin